MNLLHGFYINVYIVYLHIWHEVYQITWTTDISYDTQNYDVPSQAQVLQEKYYCFVGLNLHLLIDFITLIWELI